ncbi:hypothetical protein AMAG_17718 [Allomyces macrogynus ATCC 38327]|uniref:Uncharacterized protein n=1 Tax=Allomyces macrogynus (strain ATCC 38327) TaxID=578462 RepID=A0A0L0RXN5_ALLM3|nr:hypothetical protein AMAG_17718 [Allomyces macrogynus ATCC 38327]|eukprot:KNE54905.1 hypothetical protein AMAG_17718 [Allomyces macrogynus ATCC 38327]
MGSLARLGIMNPHPSNASGLTRLPVARTHARCGRGALHNIERTKSAMDGARDRVRITVADPFAGDDASATSPPPFHFMARVICADCCVQKDCYLLIFHCPLGFGLSPELVATASPPKTVATRRTTSDLPAHVLHVTTWAFRKRSS